MSDSKIPSLVIIDAYLLVKILFQTWDLNFKKGAHQIHTCIFLV